jgi:hypothetical protein
VPEPNLNILFEILGFCKRKFAMFIAPRDFDIAMQGWKYKWSYYKFTVIQFDTKNSDFGGVKI